MPGAVHKGLTKEKILHASEALVNEGGPAALTMRALSGRLGVAPMALYNHFEDRDAILDALADSILFRLRDRAKTAAKGRAPWKRQLKRLILAAQQMADSHPHVFRIACSRPNKPAAASAIAEDAIRILEEAGLTYRQAATTFHTFLILLQGYPFWQQDMEGHGADMAVPGWTTSRQFEAILDWLLASVESTAKRKSRTE